MIELGILIATDGLVQDGDEAFDVALLIELGEDGVEAKVHGLFVLEVEVDQRVDEVIRWWLQRRITDAPARQDLEDVGDGSGEDIGAGGVMMGDVEE